eukprot:TRINITY_DN19257_c0_g1_i2.p1 TRINITY_DN19257_c0_g1~~TRINITY_DN19257_c0_g1_i2.p1  ORF type:complete len:473 (-),score=122.54 TRINITY_DN19257_c0_g1_i2:146-1537(-)
MCIRDRVSTQSTGLELFVMAQTMAPAVVLVDPFSTGAALAEHLLERGFSLIIVLSSMRDTPMPWREQEKRELDIDCVAKIQHSTELDETVAALKALPFELMDVLVGAESGVVLYDQLCDALSLRGNRAATTSTRIDKFEQHEALRRAGLAACAQGLASNEEDLEELIARFEPSADYAVVVKSVDGSGNQGISKCESADQVREAFAQLINTTNMLGRTIGNVLLQEHLSGAEYTIDTVSCAGSHKCVAIWRQDRRALSPESPFMYVGQALLSIQDEPHLEGLVRYAFTALDALEMRYGAACLEIKHEQPRGAVLVEVNCRPDGGAGAWLPLVEESGIGYTQISALTDMYFDPNGYDSIPEMPILHAGCKRGSVSTIRSPAGGVVQRVRHEVFDRIRAMPSFLSMNLVNFPGAGEEILQTVDLLSYYGCIDLCHADPEVLHRDYQALQEIMDNPKEALVELRIEE